MGEPNQGRRALDESEAEAYARVQAEAAKGDVNAQFELGVMLANGMGAAPHDEDAAIAWLLKAAEQGHPEAAGELASAYQFHPSRDFHEEAIKWLERAAAQGDPVSQMTLGNHYQHAGKYPLAIAYYHRAAEQGNDEALKFLRRLFGMWYGEASEGGDSAAQYFLGNLYEIGAGVGHDLLQALHWYHEAARRGFVLAPYRLAILYGCGIPALESDSEASAWFRSEIASDRAGLIMREIARRHSRGTLVPVDDEKAVNCARRAVELGCSAAASLLGEAYEFGRGVPVDRAESARWYGVAAEGGDEFAASELARAYQYGEGVPLDLERAAFWYRRAVDGGNWGAKGELDALLPSLAGGASGAPSTPSPKRGLDKVAGMARLKSLLRRDVVDHVLHPERYRRYGLSLPNGILLYGPPGCGKTYIARLLAEEVGHHFVEITPGDVASPFIHDTVKQIRASFDEAAAKAPAIMFIDEFEAFVPPRGGLGGYQHYKAEEVNEFLALLNGCSEKRILVIAATNLPENIDPAVRRTGRLDKLIYVGPPDVDARREMLAFHLQNRPVSTDLDLARLAEQTEGYSASDIKFLVDQAARHAMELDEDLTPGSFRSAMAGITPSVPPEVAESYRPIAQRGGTSTN